jgi:hypothetical protein
VNDLTQPARPLPYESRMAPSNQTALDVQDDLRTDYALILVGTAAALIALAYLLLT